MARILAGVAAFFLLLTGVILIWQGHAEEPTIPSAPTPRLAAIPGPMTLSAIPAAPEADAKSKEEKRFARADKDENGRISTGRTGRAAAQGVRQAGRQSRWKAELLGMGGEDDRQV
jgi:hypothetical protein